MDFLFDLATNQLTPFGAEEISLKWRSREPVRIQFTRAGTLELLASGYGLALYLAKEGDLLAEVTDWTAPGTVSGWYEGTLILHTAALTAAFEEETVTKITSSIELHKWASGQASTPAISDNDVLAHIARPAIEPEPASEEVLTGAEDWLAARSPRWYIGITGLTGGGSTKLDGIITAGKSSLLTTIYVASELQDWLLLSGTDAENAAAGIVRPDDYAASTNEQVWKRVR
jgi:hypothetical protein